MKKLAALAMAFALTAVTFAGCGDSDKQNNSNGNENNPVSQDQADDGKTSADEDTYVIGICQLVEHEALDAATQGFKDALKEKLGDKVEFKEQTAGGDSATCATIVNQYVSADVDLILANATAPLQAAAGATDQIPILGTSITDYASALNMDDWTGTTGRNISGTSDLAPLEEQAIMLHELFPDAKNVGLIYCSAETNSVYQVDEVEAALLNLGYSCKRYTFADSNDIFTAVTNAVAECDVLYIPTDNAAAAATETINSIVEPAKKPVIAAEEGICRGCGVATLSISYYDLGYETGLMAYEVLVNGADVSTMPIKTIPVTKKYNAAMCESFGITDIIPDDYEAIE